MTIVADQAQRLRELAAQSSSAPHEVTTPVEAPAQRVRPAGTRVVAVTSGKGGVGKSNMCVNLAVRLAAQGRRVVVLDADLGTANADVLCGLEPVGTLAHVVTGRRRLDQIVLDAPGGFRLVPGVSGLASMASLHEEARARLVSQLRRLEGGADLILIDTGAGISPNVLSFTGGADEMLVVTTGEPTAITDAYALMKAAHRQHPGAPMRLLVNMVRHREEGRRVFDRMDRVCRRFLGVNLRFAGHVVWDARVATAVRHRQPFMLESPRCAASRCMESVAGRIDRCSPKDGSKGWIGRMLGWMLESGGETVDKETNFFD